ncbi:metal-dependent hydrolase [Cohnella candidum]|nr:metal-dependent hydrolase [Cohnella candidum]
MDYMTHSLFGVAAYAAQDKSKLDVKTKIALLATSVGANIIPDIDIQWATKTNDSYLIYHRGITHSFLMAPVWAGLFALLAFLLVRAKGKRFFLTALAGVLLHIVSDWTNPWGTGLLEPFTSRRYVSGFIPNKGYVFWCFAAAIAVLLPFFRMPKQRLRVLRGFWALSAFYVLFQLGHASYLYADLKAQGYEHVAIRADRWPGGFSYYAKKGGEIVEGRSDLRGRQPSGIVQEYRTDPVDLDPLMENPSARALILFAPFVGTQDLGDSVRLFDPRFAGRRGFLDIVVPKPNPSSN